MPDFGGKSKLVALDLVYNHLDIAKGSDTKTKVDAIRSKTRVRYTPQCDALFEDGLLEVEVRKALNKPWSKLTADDMAELTELKLTQVPVYGLKGIEHAINLKKLVCDETRISEISALVSLTKLEELQLGRSRVTDLEAIRNLTQLRVLGVNELEIKDIGCIAGLKKLTALVICRSKLADLGFLGGLINLVTLDVSNNLATDSRPLVTLVNMQQLNINNLKFTDYHFLSQMSQLKYGKHKDEYFFCLHRICGRDLFKSNTPQFRRT